MFSALSHFVFGASSLFSSHDQSDSVKASTWKDKKLCFDLRTHDLELNRGEQLIGCFYPIEDVKGNQDELGVLEVTNLRLIWMCVSKKRVNLSIGWRTVTLTYEHNLKDPLCSNSTSLFVLCKYESTKYEFVFAKQNNQADIWSNEGDPESWKAMSRLRRLSQDSAFLVSHLSPSYLDDPFEMVLKVWQAYKQTILFRHCRSNMANLVALPEAAMSQQQAQEQGAKLEVEDIVRLPSEEIIQMFAGVIRNNSRTSTFTGTLYLTNVRLIWLDNAYYMRNLSIPYIRINSIKMKQGKRILVKTSDYLSSSTQVEFQVSGMSMEAKTIFEEIQQLYLSCKSKPRYGPESCEDCINFISHLRPLELYYETLDKSMVKAMENFGPEANPLRPSDDGTRKAHSDLDSETMTKSRSDDSNNDEVDRAEKELDGYATKLACYLNERPLKMDNELIYSTDLGLAMEKPISGASISSIWRIDV